jgi:hypothetical protein
MTSIMEISPDEIHESQLDIDDFRALRPLSPQAVKCPGVYCSTGYSDEPDTTEPDGPDEPDEPIVVEEPE